MFCCAMWMSQACVFIWMKSRRFVVHFGRELVGVFLFWKLQELYAFHFVLSQLQWNHYWTSCFNISFQKVMSMFSNLWCLDPPPQGQVYASCFSTQMYGKNVMYVGNVTYHLRLSWILVQIIKIKAYYQRCWSNFSKAQKPRRQNGNWNLSSKMFGQTSKLLWVKAMLGANSKMMMVKCKVYKDVESWKNFLMLKSDDLHKHIGHCKVIVTRQRGSC
jgi:hypothetical protein